MSKTDEIAVVHGTEFKDLKEEQVEDVFVTEEFEGPLAAEIKRLTYLFRNKTEKTSFTQSRKIWVLCQEYGIDVPEDVYKRFLAGNKKLIPKEVKEESSAAFEQFKEEFEQVILDLNTIEEERTKHKSNAACYRALSKAGTFGAMEPDSIGDKYEKLKQKIERCYRMFGIEDS